MPRRTSLSLTCSAIQSLSVRRSVVMIAKAQLYFHSDPAAVDSKMQQLVACVDVISQWMDANRLKLNKDKTVHMARYTTPTVQAQLPLCRAWRCQHPDINPSNVYGSSAGQCTDVCTSRATPLQPEFLPPTTDEDSSQITHRRCRQDHGPCLCHESDRLL